MRTCQLANKSAIITGASKGLGAHFACVIAREGAHVILAARNRDSLDAVAAKIRADGGTCETIALDVCHEGEVKRLSSTFERVDILINNAGITHAAPAIDHSVADWDAVMNTNLRGTFLLSQAVAKAMVARGAGGSIVNIASILGLRQSSGVVSYAVSKAGVIQLTRALALEWSRPGIRVNAIAPGYIETDLNRDFWQTDAGEATIRRIPQRRLGRPEELDGALLLLASDMSSYMTGSVIEVDGGHLASTL